MSCPQKTTIWKHLVMDDGRKVSLTVDQAGLSTAAIETGYSSGYINIEIWPYNHAADCNWDAVLTLQRSADGGQSWSNLETFESHGVAGESHTFMLGHYDPERFAPSEGISDPSNHGNGTLTLVTPGPNVQLITYRLVYLYWLGVFKFFDVPGANLPNVTPGVAYTSNQLNFTINTGGTPFVSGDSFTILPFRPQYRIVVSDYVSGRVNVDLYA